MNDQKVAEVVNLHTDKWAQVVLQVMVANEEHHCRLEEELMGVKVNPEHEIVAEVVANEEHRFWLEEEFGIRSPPPVHYRGIP